MTLINVDRAALLALIQRSAMASFTANPLDAMALEICSNGNPSAVAVLRRLLDTVETTLDAVDAQGNTLLHLAARAGSSELVALLLSRRPELATKRNATDLKPLDVATGATHALVRMATPIDLTPALQTDPEPMEEEPAEEVVDASLLGLPEEMQMQIMFHLDGLRARNDAWHLLQLRACCKKLRTIADSDTVWERLCWTTYKRCARTSCLAGTWKEIYIEHTLLQGDSKARQEKERTQRYLDRRSLAGLSLLSQAQSVEGSVFDLS